MDEYEFNVTEGELTARSRIMRIDNAGEEPYFMIMARGLLIYPAQEVPIRDEVRIRNTSVSVQQTTINLGGSGEQLSRACDDLAREVFVSSGQ